MNVELRPLSLGEILDRIFQLYRRNFLLFTGIASFAAGAILVWRLAHTALMQALGHRVGAQTVGFVNIGYSLLDAAFYAVAGALAMAATNRAVSAIYLGRETGIAQAYGEVMGRWLRYVWLHVVVILLAWGPVFLCFGGVAAGAMLMVKRSPMAVMGLLGAFGLSLIVLLPFGIWMTLRYSLSNPACVFEDLGVGTALKRSVFLSRGAEEKAKIFVVFFVMGVISAVLLYGGMAPLLLLGLRSAASRTQPALSFGMQVYALIVGFVANSIAIPIYSIGLTLFYYDARIRKEGFDVQWMIDRANGPELPGSVPGTATAG